MAGYLNQNGNSIGSLLRFIQEQKSQSPIVPQASSVGSPFRDVVQQPLSGSEGQGTSKVVSLRPEGTLTPSGNPIEQGAPQSSRVGPISIGGTDVGPVAPPSVVAANEQGQGFTIPSASRTVGDVINKTGLASPKSPSLGTTIKASTPTTRSGLEVAKTTQGQEVGNYSLARDRERADKTMEFVKGEIERGNRSTAETQADLDAAERAANEGPTTAEIDTQLLNRGMKAVNTSGSPENLALLASARRTRDEINSQPTPSPTPMPTVNPMAPGAGQVLGSNSPSNGFIPTSNSGGAPIVKAVNGSPMVKQYNPKANAFVYQPVKAPTPPKPAPAKPAAKAPSIGTILGGGALAGLKKLFGWK